ncbi:MAG: hypothetical protein KAI94_09275, partial [Anaerolineales bacterium]|nr:hypothetical protein [Anaerolineales bacterium]
MTTSELPSSSKIPGKSLLSQLATQWSSMRATIVNLLAFIGQRLAFGALVLLFIIFLTYLGLDMATGTDFSTAFKDAIPSTIHYIQRLLHGSMGMTTAGSLTYIP